MNVIFYIYLFSGILKGIMKFYGIHLPIDLTALTGAVLAIDVIFHVFKRALSGLPFSKLGLYPLIVLLAFTGWMAFTLLYTPSESYSKAKLFYFSTNIIAFAYPIFHIKLNISKMLKYFVLGFAIVTFWYVPILMHYINSPELHALQRYNNVFNLYLVIGLYSGFSVILLVIRPKLFKHAWVRVFLLIFFLTSLFLSGARASIIITLLLLIVILFERAFMFLISASKMNQRKMVMNAFLTLFIITGILVVSVLFSGKINSLASRSVKRFDILVNSLNVATPENKRFKQLEFSMDKISESVSSVVHGYGIGSYGVIESAKDARAYPHNFILEIQFETGIIGLLLFLLFLFTIFINSKSYAYPLPVFIFLYFLLNYLKSWSIVDMRICFAFLGIFILQQLPEYKNQIKENE
jgi:O-antigen ligase